MGAFERRPQKLRYLLHGYINDWRVNVYPSVESAFAAKERDDRRCRRLYLEPDRLVYPIRAGELPVDVSSAIRAGVGPEPIPAPG